MDKDVLTDFYLKKQYSVAQISKKTACSESTINYWLSKYAIKKRSISEAVYIRSNPDGDPFKISEIDSPEKAFLYGLGLGLFWGEGNKRELNSVRLGNSDPFLIKIFIRFLKTVYNIDSAKLKFGLQIFNDCSPQECLQFWVTFLKVPEACFQKIVVSQVRGPGTYKNKSKHGVLTVYFNNKKLRNIVCNAIENLRKA